MYEIFLNHQIFSAFSTDLVRTDRIVKAVVSDGVTVGPLTVKFLLRQPRLALNPGLQLLSGSFPAFGHSKMSEIWTLQTKL